MVETKGSPVEKNLRSRKKPESMGKKKLEQLGKIDILSVENHEGGQNTEYEVANCISVTNWFLTFLIQDLPIIGEIALLIWAFSKRNAVGKRQYAIARLAYKLIFDVIAILILMILFNIVTGALEALMTYMEAL